MPARTAPAEVITPPVAASPVTRAGPGALPLRLLPHPGHQEDVVVDAECDEEDEHEQRERRVFRAEVEHVVEEQRAHPEGGREGQHHGGDQHDGRDEGTKQQHQDDEDHGEGDRDDQRPVMGRRPLDVEVDRGIPADERVRAGDGVHRVAGPVDGRVGGLAVRRAGERGLKVGVARDRRRGR